MSKRALPPPPASPAPSAPPSAVEFAKLEARIEKLEDAFDALREERKRKRDDAGDDEDGGFW